MNKASLSERAGIIIKSNPELAMMKTAIEKELIHYDIFFLLQQKELILPGMAFIGGTCLRLCHGSNRYSEDLDFHAGPAFKARQFDAIRLEIERYLHDRYRLPVEVRPPSRRRQDSSQYSGQVNTWKIIIPVAPRRRDMPAQRVHIDIASLPTHDASPRLLYTHYDTLPGGYDSMLFLSSSKSEILADKLVALTARRNIMARDIWDVIWLLQQGEEINPEILRLKLADHRIIDYKEKAENKINELPGWFETGKFQHEMLRFLSLSQADRTVKRPEFITFTQDKITRTLGDSLTRLDEVKP